MEEQYYGELPPKLSYILLNLALCYKRKGELDAAEKMYLK